MLYAPCSMRTIPYARQCIDDDDIAAVVEVLRSDWLTTGPKVPEFEEAVAQFVGAKYAVAVSNGTAALHAAMYAIGIGPGDEVILPPMTFVATANSVVFQGGTPVFADVAPDTLLIDPDQVEEKLTPRTKAIVAVDYAGQPCDYDTLQTIANKHGLILIADACHALGAEYKGKRVGTLADLTVFSFHPVKHITTGEGGMVVTDDSEFAEKMRRFRNHGITRDPKCFSSLTSPPASPERAGSRWRAGDLRPPRPPRLSEQARDGGQVTSDFSWYYEMLDLGYNYRITDIQCALGLSQLNKLSGWLKRRNDIARRYGTSIAEARFAQPLRVREDVIHAYHLYVARFTNGVDRNKTYQTMREKGVGANVHYIPVHLHPYYRRSFETSTGLCPVAESAYKRIISLPMHHGLSNENVERVIHSLKTAVG